MEYKVSSLIGKFIDNYFSSLEKLSLNITKIPCYDDFARNNKTKGECNKDV